MQGRSSRSPRGLLSFLGVVLAAVASIATSAPEPDWVLENTANGELRLEPGEQEKTFRVRASTKVVGASLSIDVALDPVAPRESDLYRTPIVLFVSTPVSLGAAGADAGVAKPRLTAVPTMFSAGADGFEPSVTGTSIAAPDKEEVFEVKIAWETPDPTEREATKLDEGFTGSQLVAVTRPTAPRRPTTIRWRARIHADGYDDQPAGAAVHVEAAP